MNSHKFPYQGQIETILHYLNSMIQKNWTGKTADEFNRLISIPELAKMACMSVRNLQLMFKAYTSETLHQYIIVTFSRKMMEYQRTIRERQLERAKKLLRLKDPEKIKKGQNKFCPHGNNL